MSHPSTLFSMRLVPVLPGDKPPSSSIIAPARVYAVQDDVLADPTTGRRRFIATADGGEVGIAIGSAKVSAGMTVDRDALVELHDHLRARLLSRREREACREDAPIILEADTSNRDIVARLAAALGIE